MSLKRSRPTNLQYAVKKMCVSENELYSLKNWMKSLEIIKVWLHCSFFAVFAY